MTGRLSGVARRACAAAVACAAAFVASCEREERGFRVEPPSSARVNTIRQSDLQPGTALPAPHTTNEYEENAQAVAEGKRLYEWYNCKGCHAQGGGDIGPPLMDAKWIYGGDPAQIFATVVEGRPNGMPSFRGKIPDHQVWQIVAYVRSMGGHTTKDVAPGRDDNMTTKKPEASAPEQDIKNSSIPKSAERPE